MTHNTYIEMYGGDALRVVESESFSTRLSRNVYYADELPEEEEPTVKSMERGSSREQRVKQK